MRTMTMLAAAFTLGAAPLATAQERTLDDVRIDYDASVRCAGVYGAAATGKAIEHFERHPDVTAYREHEQQFARYAGRFGPQLKIPDGDTQVAISDVRRQSYGAAREALFNGDEAGFRARLASLYALVPDCEAARVRLIQSIGTF